MEEIKLLELLFQNIDIIYIIMCNICTYAIIQIIKDLNIMKLTKGSKRIVSTAVALILAIILYNVFYHNLEALFYGFFIQFLSWDYFFKPCIKSLVEKIKGDD